MKYSHKVRLSMTLAISASALSLGLIAPTISSASQHAHLSGTIFGVVISFLMMAVGLLPRDPYDVIALLNRWRRRREYQSLVAQGYDPFGTYQPATAPG